MPSFHTPQPITLIVRIESGDITVDATDRSDADVEVRPKNPTRSADVKRAESTTVEHRDGVITVKTPQGRSWLGPDGKVDVTARVPTGSSVEIAASAADVRSTGRLDKVEVKSASGDVDVDRAGTLTATTASGDIACRTVDGQARAQTASGDIELGTVAGAAKVSTASGDVRCASSGADLDVQTASGDIDVIDASSSVQAKTATGDVQIRTVRQGSIAVNAVSGDVEIAIADGVTAWLDLVSRIGTVTSELDDANPPPEGTATVTVSAHTTTGDIRVRRAR